MKNQVIKNLTPEMGKEIIEYWKGLGVDTRWLGGNACEINNYYGVINGVFYNYNITEVTDANAEIIELPSKQPKRGNKAEFWNDASDGTVERYFLAEIKGAKYPFVAVPLIYETDFLEGKPVSTAQFKNMRPLSKKTVTQDEITKLGLEAYAKLHNTSVDNILIN